MYVLLWNVYQNNKVTSYDYHMTQNQGSCVAKFVFLGVDPKVKYNTNERRDVLQILDFPNDIIWIKVYTCDS